MRKQRQEISVERKLEIELAMDELESPEKPKVYSKKLQDKNFKL